jgi:hypothetical protein
MEPLLVEEVFIIYFTDDLEFLAGINYSMFVMS